MPKRCAAARSTSRLGCAPKRVTTGYSSSRQPLMWPPSRRRCSSSPTAVVRSASVLQPASIVMHRSPCHSLSCKAKLLCCASTGVATLVMYLHGARKRDLSSVHKPHLKHAVAAQQRCEASVDASYTAVIQHERQRVCCDCIVASLRPPTNALHRFSGRARLRRRYDGRHANRHTTYAANSWCL